MRESTTIHCPRCGKTLDAYTVVDNVEFGTDGRDDHDTVTVTWKPWSTDHKCSETFGQQ
jgi:hypothetical protein